LLLAVVFTLLHYDCQALSCLNEEGNEVDWFIVYKLPIIQKDPRFGGGLGYAYMDLHKSMDLSNATLDQSNTAISYTLEQIYQGTTANVGWVMYNDDYPNGGNPSNKGHSKGVVAFDRTGGYWLVHSIPRFPQPYSAGGFQFPNEERIYGQTFLCLSLDLDNVDLVGGQFFYTWPGVYDSNMPKSLTNRLPSIQSVINGYTLRGPVSNISEITTLALNSFFSFAKTARWGQDLYEYLVCPYIKGGLMLMTWMRPYLGSFCPPEYTYPNLNINTISFGDIQFGETKDHSKWGISTDAKSAWVCIGDINHMTSQNSRSGGTVCFQNKQVYNTFKNLISDSDSCP